MFSVSSLNRSTSEGPKRDAFQGDSASGSLYCLGTVLLEFSQRRDLGSLRLRFTSVNCKKLQLLLRAREIR